MTLPGNVVPALAKRASGAVIWIATARIVSQFFQIVVAAILTRILSPDDFGLIAMVMAFSGFLTVVSNAGISSAVVQFRDLTRHDLRTMFTLSALVGIGMTLLFAALSGVLATFYSMPVIRPICILMSVSFTITALSRISSGLLEREMAFRMLAWIRVIASVFAGIVAVIAALTGASYWSLIIQIICNDLAMTILTMVAAKFRPTIGFDLNVVRRVVSYAGNLTLFNIVNYWARNFDNLIVGRVLGAASLGFYNRAYALMLYPVSALTSVVTPVLHPILAGIQDDVPRVAKAYLRIVRFVAIIAFPGMMALGLLAPEVIEFVWGTGWARSEHIFQILCVVGAVQSVIAVSSSVFLALGRATLLFRVGLINSAIVIAGIAIGLHWGLNGVATGYALAACVTAIPTLYLVTTRLLHAAWSDIYQTLSRPIGVSIVVAIPILAINYLLRDAVSPFIHLATVILSSVPVYAAALRLFAPDFIAEVVQLLPSSVRNRLNWLVPHI